jgi:hypothetical protein
MMQVAVADQVKDAVGSTSLLLVFVTVLFNAKYAEIRSTAALPRPSRPAEQDQWRQTLRDCLVAHVAPLLVVAAGATAIFLPVVVNILTHRQLAYWDNLDFGATTFVFVFIVVTGLALWALWRAVQLLGKITGSLP